MISNESICIFLLSDIQKSQIKYKMAHVIVRPHEVLS